MTGNEYKSNDFKVYIKVIAQFGLDGKVKPMEIIWEDGRRFCIDRVLDERPAASTKAGGVGRRYTVRILNKERYLWYDECEKVWFMERK